VLVPMSALICSGPASCVDSAIILIRMPGTQIRRVPRAPRTVPA
jgi:hypothetical protein